MSESQNTSKDVTQQETMLSPDQLRSITSMDDALVMLQEELGAQVYDASQEIGDGFTLLEDKDRLINEPFIAVSWLFADGDYGTDAEGRKLQFLVMRLVTQRGEKFVITDGSPTGVCGQVQDFTRRTNTQRGLIVKGGLRKSTYDTVINGETVHGTTHYLNV